MSKPDQVTTASQIFGWYESKTEDFREHLGASLIGHPCNRYLWLNFRWAVKAKFEGRILRLFNTGHREEARIHEELRGIGVELYVEENGKQITCRNDFGHFGGSVDGVGKGFVENPNVWAVLECKTMGDKAFTKLRAWNVENEKPQHFAQMQVYMGLLNLDAALYIAVNKNTDAIHTEWITADNAVFKQYNHRANTIVEAKTAPLKLSDDPTYWECKFCDMYRLCHHAEPAQVNCRTCAHSTPIADGKWRCELADTLLTGADQRKGCDQHLLIPDFVHGAEPIDAGVNFIEYKNKETGEIFTHGKKVTAPRDSLAKRQAEGRKRGSNNGLPFNDEVPF